MTRALPASSAGSPVAGTTALMIGTGFVRVAVGIWKTREPTLLEASQD